MKDLVKIIKDKGYNVVIVSPHQDDAVLSCGGLLTQLVGKTDITVVNVFTKAHKKPYTLSTKMFLKASGFTDATLLYQVRFEEDTKVLAMLGIKPVNLDLEDALFRRKKNKTWLGNILSEFDHVYPTYRWHIIKNIAKDDYAGEELKKQLIKFKNKKTLVIAPLGIGNHADHVIVGNVCEALFDNLFFYADFPYTIRENSDKTTLPK